MSLLAPDATEPPVYYSGSLQILDGPAVAIVGSRAVSEDGLRRARRLAREISLAGVTVVSGLAKGVDTAAHVAALDVGCATVAVIGTPLEKAYPVENARLQEQIAAEHLLLSPFAPGERVFPSNFPKRNRVMAAVTDGTVIVEAGDTSGTLHQAAECQRLGRWLFVLRSVYDDTSLEWPRRFASYERMRVVTTAEDVVGAVVR
ncbi:MAG: DNA-protecting protein DprA [Brevundimonas sp.]|uniref:DNA-processing protein DprA n=1 Tax=Brevundimonas sp. TaxID=1871086 RepID=UPI00256BF2FD|nr:DNA-processing protein DprA [Brevundimonas sp.]MDK2748715.1 DNA-protecting protein DprA [Brevundimonas sp.]